MTAVTSAKIKGHRIIRDSRNESNDFLYCVLNRCIGLITDDLITVDNEEQRKYMGVFKLPGEGQKVIYLNNTFVFLPLSLIPRDF